MAMEEAAKIGINIDSKIIDTQNDIKEIENQLKLIDTLALDLIVGPLLPKNFNFLTSQPIFKNIPNHIFFILKVFELLFFNW